ncbi:MAG TPA: hypothetical protein VMF52_05085 [Steroidobacteraceae bacterium]|nr:hypothetical protein [Steroidobacteraceae bacterium]
MQLKKLVAAMAMPLLILAVADPSLAGGNKKAVGVITTLPEPETYTTPIHSIPNPFISWEGNKFERNDWELRQAQFKRIIEHYETGYLPSTDGITTSLEVTKAQSGYTAANQAGTAQVTVYKDGVAAAHKINVQFFFPDPAVWPVPKKGYPVVFNPNGNVSGWFNVANQYGIAQVGIQVRDIDSGDNETGSYVANGRAGVVQDLFDLVSQMPDASRTAYSAGLVNGQWLPPYQKTEGNLAAPSLMLSQAWGVSRVLDAVEADKKAASRLINVDMNKSAFSGISRLGKLTLVVGAFEPRIQVVNPVSSGSGGTVIDRSTSAAVSERQYYGIDPSYGYDYELNKKYYYVKIKDKSEFDNTWAGDAVLAAEALIDPNGRRDGGTTTASPYQGNEDYRDFASSFKVADGQINFLGTGANATSTTGVGHGNNIKPGYGVINFGIQTAAGVEFTHNQGTQNFLDVRWGYGSWFTPRFRKWNTTPEQAWVDVIKRANRGEYGQLSVEPFDQHYLMGMIAPRALLIQDGYLSNNTNPEGTYIGYLAGREIYRFMGEEEKIGINIHVINHANPLREQMELGEFMTAVFKGKNLPKKFHQQPFPINDPRSTYDYQKLDWAAAGWRSLKEQVDKLCEEGRCNGKKSVHADDYLK